MLQEKIYDFGSQHLIFGLKWQPISGQVKPQHIKLITKRQKAKAWVIAGQTFMSLGLSYSRSPNKTSIYAAAVCYAFLYPKGWHASIYQLNEGLYWLAVVHEGTPMSLGDVLFDDEKAAQAALQSLAQQYPELSYAEQVSALADFLALIATHALQKATLHPVRTLSWRPLFLFCVALGALYWWRIEPTPVAVAAEPEVDPYLLVWQQKKLQTNGKDALRQLLLSWEKIPLQLQDWQLQRVNCEVRKAAEHWACQVHYGAMNHQATAMQIESLLPENWQIKEVTMQSVVLENRIDFLSARGGWRSAEQVRLQLLSQLQPIRPAFSALTLGEPSVLTLGIPTQSQYTPIFSQVLRFEGPLRSLPLLVDLDEKLHWQQVSLTHQPQRQASLKSSALQASLRGVVYVRD